MVGFELSEENGNHRENVLQLLHEENSVSLSAYLQELHPVELVAVLSSLDDDEQRDLLKHVTGLDQFSEVVTLARDRLRQTALEMIDDSRIAAVIRRQELDDAADILGNLPRRRQVKIMRRLGAPTVKELKILLAYDQDTAGRIMTPRFLSFPVDITANEAIVQLRANLFDRAITEDTDLFYGYVLNSRGELRGVFSLRELLSAEPQIMLSDLMHAEPLSVHPDEDQEVVARLIADYDLASIPVVSEEGEKLLGIITVDDVIDIIEEEHAEDLLRLAGTDDDDTVGASLFLAIKRRLPWLAASWLGGICGAMLLGSYSSTLEKVVALAFFMPIVFGMGGNVGSQSSTITVRGLATGELGQDRVFGRLQKEALVGATLGLLFGVLLSGASYLLYENIRLSAIVGCSIAATMICAASLGSMLPVMFQRLGFDPAIASGPFVTTSTDILSISIYFAIATFLL